MTILPNGDSSFPLALEVRFRRALGGPVTLDLGVGRSDGFVSHVGVSYDTRFHVFAHGELVDEWRWIVGGGASGRPGLYAAIAIALLSVTGVVNQQAVYRPGAVNRKRDGLQKLKGDG
jgi:hypothetical protein